MRFYANEAFKLKADFGLTIIIYSFIYDFIRRFFAKTSRTSTLKYSTRNYEFLDLWRKHSTAHTVYPYVRPLFVRAHCVALTCKFSQFNLIILLLYTFLAYFPFLMLRINFIQKFIKSIVTRPNWMSHITWFRRSASAIVDWRPAPSPPLPTTTTIILVMLASQTQNG